MKNRKTVVIVLFLMAGLSVQCARFKVNNLSSETVFSAKIGKTGKVNYEKNQNDLVFGVPRRAAVIDEWVVISEPAQGTVKIFRSDELQLRIVARNKIEQEPDKEGEQEKTDIANRVIDDYLRTPGSVVPGIEEDFFVKNFARSTEASAEGGFFKILHFDLKGERLGIIGREGQPELPFENILWMDTDTENTLWVYYRYLDRYQLDQYEDHKLKLSFNQDFCEENLFQAIEREEKMLYQCEYMYPFYSGKKILLVGKVELAGGAADSYNFQYRVFKLYDVDSGETIEIFGKLNDPEDYPYLPLDENHIMLWKTQNYQQVKFAVYTTEGDLKNNLQIEMKGEPHSWRSTWATLDGRFFSTRIAGGNLEIIRWN